MNNAQDNMGAGDMNDAAGFGNGSTQIVEAQARGETDIQISTAKRYPRSLKKFKSDALSMATLDQQTAAGCFYSLSRNGRDGKKTIEGPSARLAEIIANAWGNVRAQASVISTDGNFVTARGITWDLERNVAISFDVQRRITDRNGRRFSDDMIVVTSNAACSIALRNSVFKVVPAALWKDVYEKAREVAVGNAQTFGQRRDELVSAIRKMGVSPEQIAAAVDKASVADITLTDLATLIGLFNAVRDGEQSVDEAFPQPDDEGKQGVSQTPPASKTDRLAEKFAQKTPSQNPQPNQQPTRDGGASADDSAQTDNAGEAGNSPAGASGSQSTQSDVERDGPAVTVTDEEVGTYESFHAAMEQHAAELKLDLDAFDKLMKSLGPAGHDVKHSRTNIAMKARKTVLAAFRAGTLGMDGKIQS